MQATIEKIVLDRKLLAEQIQHRRGQLGLPPINFEEDGFRREVTETIQKSPSATPNAAVTKFLLKNNDFMAAETKKMLAEAVRK